MRIKKRIENDELVEVHQFLSMDSSSPHTKLKLVAVNRDWLEVRLEGLNFTADMSFTKPTALAMSRTIERLFKK